MVRWGKESVKERGYLRRIGRRMEGVVEEGAESALSLRNALSDVAHDASKRVVSLFLSLYLFRPQAKGNEYRTRLRISTTRKSEKTASAARFG